MTVTIAITDLEENGQATFNQLHNYSCSRPTGAYEGKMWRCHVGAHDPGFRPKDRYWILCWFGLSDDPAMVSNNSRRILLV